MNVHIIKEYIKNKYILAGLSAALVVISFPYFSLYPLIFISLLGFIYSIDKSESIKEAALGGFIYGFLVNLGAFYWLIETINNYSNLGTALGAVGLLFYALYGSLLFVIISSLSFYIRKRSNFSFFVFFPFLFAAGEYLFPVIFPWQIGACLYPLIPLIQICDITGIYGVSYLVVLINAFLYLAVTKLKWREFYKEACIVFVLLIITLTYGFIQSHKYSNDPSKDEMKITVIQPNIDLEEKKGYFDNEQDMLIAYNKHVKLTENVLSNNSDIYIWPETALPFTYTDFGYYTGKFLDDLKRLQITLLTGAVARDGYTYFNRALVFDEAANLIGKYNKINLLIFGEYIPFSETFPFLKNLIEGPGDFQAGKFIDPIKVGPSKIIIPICYEIIKPRLIRKLLTDKANLIINITNDAWFGDTTCPYTHFMLSIFRAIENRIPIVRATNTGITAFVDNTGKIVKRTKLFKAAILTDNVKIKKYSTFYRKFGDVFAILCCIISVFFIISIFRRK